MSCSKARVSSACRCVCSAIFSLNFRGLALPEPGEAAIARPSAGGGETAGAGPAVRPTRPSVSPQAAQASARGPSSRATQERSRHGPTASERPGAREIRPRAGPALGPAHRTARLPPPADPSPAQLADPGLPWAPVPAARRSRGKPGQ